MKNQLLPQLFGTFIFLMPFIVAYNQMGDKLFSWPSIILFALIYGFIFAANIYYSSIKRNYALLYIPTDNRLQALNDEIRKCNMQPENVCLRYAYSGEMIATSNFNTITLDPLQIDGFEEDPEAIKVKNIYHQIIAPTLIPAQRDINAKTKELLTTPAQRFIFRHELGHINSNYSYKMIVISGIIAAISISSSLMVASATIATLGGIAGLILGISAFYSVDLVSGYTNNYFLKAYEEKQADIFAAKFCTEEEINAAADFFENHEPILQDLRTTKVNKLLCKLPSAAISGHPHGKTRADYLRKLATSKLHAY